MRLAGRSDPAHGGLEGRVLELQVNAEPGAQVRMAVYADAIIIDADEHRTLANFETDFNISVRFAGFPPDGPYVCHPILNRSLAELPRDFMAALSGAISLR